MKKSVPKILLAGWCLWVILRLIRTILNPGLSSSTDPAGLGAMLGGLLIPAAGCWLAWRLYIRPQRSVGVWFAIVCVILLWKFCVGPIVFFMHPSLGGYTFGGACGAWWHEKTSGILPFLDSIPPTILLLVSIIYWPTRCARNT